MPYCGLTSQVSGTPGQVDLHDMKPSIRGFRDWAHMEYIQQLSFERSEKQPANPAHKFPIHLPRARLSAPSTGKCLVLSIVWWGGARIIIKVAHPDSSNTMPWLSCQSTFIRGLFANRMWETSPAFLRYQTSCQVTQEHSARLVLRCIYCHCFRTWRFPFSTRAEQVIVQQYFGPKGFECNRSVIQAARYRHVCQTFRQDFRLFRKYPCGKAEISIRVSRKLLAMPYVLYDPNLTFWRSHIGQNAASPQMEWNSLAPGDYYLSLDVHRHESIFHWRYNGHERRCRNIVW